MLRGEPSWALLEHSHTFPDILTYARAHQDTLKATHSSRSSRIIRNRRFSTVHLSSTYLSLRHDVEVAAVVREGHVSEDGAAVLDHRYCLVLDTAVRRSINANLRKTEHKTGQGLLFISERQRKWENRQGVIDRNDRRGSHCI